jgi:nucleoside-diphosphate-sugar epimerase
MKKVLVTGGAGYIGSVLVRILLQQGYKVRTIDNLSFGGEALLEVMSNKNFEFYNGDIRNDKDLDNVLKDIDAVCHLAAIVGDPACKKFSTDANEINWDASVKLLNKSEEQGVKRFIFASTCSNYGKMADPGSYVTENSDLRPVSLYAELKVKFEKHLLEQKDFSMCRTVLRFSTVYGASPRLRFDLTVNEFTRDAYLKRELVIFGEQFWRPYCHVYDLANSVVTALESDVTKVNGEVYNVGDTSENYTKKMLVEQISKIIPDLKINYVHSAEDPRDYRVNFDKIAKDLKFKITRRVPDGIREIHLLLSSKVISDPYAEKYSNTFPKRYDVGNQ